VGSSAGTVLNSGEEKASHSNKATCEVRIGKGIAGKLTCNAKITENDLTPYR
jgi:hypothetical protein